MCVAAKTNNPEMGTPTVSTDSFKTIYQLLEYAEQNTNSSLFTVVKLFFYDLEVNSGLTESR